MKLLLVQTTHAIRKQKSRCTFRIPTSSSLEVDPSFACAQSSSSPETAAMMSKVGESAVGEQYQAEQAPILLSVSSPVNTCWVDVVIRHDPITSSMLML